VECHLDERRVSHQVCSHLANYLLTIKVSIFQQLYCHQFKLGKQGKKYQPMFYYVDTNDNRIDLVDLAPKANNSRVSNT
jgi:hypothetical protein